MLEVLDRAASCMGLENDDYSFLRYPEKILMVSIPVKMDDGSTKIFEGYRVQHSSMRGPCKGGIRYHQNTNLDEVKALSAWMSFKCAVAGIPYCCGKGGITVDPRTLSLGELERLTRGYTERIFQIIGPDKDIPAPDVNTNGMIMGWIMDTYSRLNGKNTPGVVTGKPLSLGGSLGRPQATGRGISFMVREILNKLGKEVKGTRIAIQGMGNVGGTACKLLYDMGCVIVAVSTIDGGAYKKDGINVPEMMKFLGNPENKITSYQEQGLSYVSNEDVLESDVDLLIPAALENSITEEIAGKIQAKSL